MADYKLISDRGSTSGIIKKTKDIPANTSVNIPIALDNTDYQEYLKWVAAGNTPDPAD